MEDENETRKKVFVGFDKRSANRYVLNKDGDVFRPFQQKRGPSKKKNRKRKFPDWRIEMNFVHFFFYTQTIRQTTTNLATVTSSVLEFEEFPSLLFVKHNNLTISTQTKPSPGELIATRTHDRGLLQ